MFIVYILYSETAQKYYTGHTHNFENRIIEHNSGKTTSIKNGIPWHCIWKTNLDSRAEAMQLEKKIKKRGAKRYLEDIQFC